QAEDGIRDRTVTGVQTCALPISGAAERGRKAGWEVGRTLQGFVRGRFAASQGPQRCRSGLRATRRTAADLPTSSEAIEGGPELRSEERRVGKGGGGREGAGEYKQ